jgi:tetratricopeptide (TPR) repeat protein
MMKNRPLTLLIIAFLSLLIISSYKVFESTNYQTTLLYDFNNGEYTLPYEIYSNKLDDNYPNLSVTTLPIKVLKARYFIENDSFKYAKKLLFDAIKVNPYLKSSEVLLADIYFNEKKYDSSLFFSKNAFYQLPNVNSHRNIYFKNLKLLNDTLELDNAFNMIKGYNKMDNWYEYIIVRNEMGAKNDLKLLNLVQEFKNKFPNENHSKINNLEKIIKVGAYEYSESYKLSQSALKEFQSKNYLKAVKLYESAIFLNNLDYVFYENAGIAHALLKNYEDAFKKYDEVIYRFETNNGKSEYLKGILSMQLNIQDQGCKYLKQAAQKKYIDKATNVNPAVLVQNFCN